MLTFLVLHFFIFLFSLSSVCSKFAGQYDFMSPGFIVFYGAVLVILFAYAIAWQQVIKRMDLTVAYANKAVTVIWGGIWGFVFFQEEITLKKVIGAIIVMAGVILYSLADKSDVAANDITESAQKEANKEDSHD